MVGRKAGLQKKRKNLHNSTFLWWISYALWGQKQASRHSATKTPRVMLGVQSISCNSGSVVSQTSVPMQWCVVRVNIRKFKNLIHYYFQRMRKRIPAAYKVFHQVLGSTLVTIFTNFFFPKKGVVHYLIIWFRSRAET